jgi:germination protein M
MRRALLLTLLALLAVTGCGSSRSASRTVGATPATRTGATTTTTAATTVTAPAETVLRAYLLRDGLVAPVARSVPRTQAVARAALVQLLTGPTAEETSAGFTTDVPSGARLLGVTIAGGTATVDFAHAFAEGAEATISPRLAQVVYTLTQFPTIERVSFRLDGRPLPGVTDGVSEIVDHPPGRADYEALTPPLLVESPLPGETVTSPLRISGSANAFEATFQAELVDASGTVLVHRTVMATSGSGERGTFEESLPFEGSGAGKLVVYEDSAADGSRIHEVAIPLQLR